MTEPTHYDLAVILAVSGAVQLTGLVILGLLLREARRDVHEAQRLTRAVAGLVVQETDKIRAALEGLE